MSSANRWYSKYMSKLGYMINDADFSKWLGTDASSKILKYRDLVNYQTIYDLIPNKNDYRIILTESQQNVGHWCALLRYNNSIEWWDSYGVRPDGELQFIPAKVKRELGETQHHLTRLINTANRGEKVVYNHKKFQTLKDGINTCGKWVIARVKAFLNGFDLKHFQDFIENECIEKGKPADVVVCDCIN